MTGFKYKGRGVVQLTGRQHGKSVVNQYMNTWYDIMSKPPTIRWQQLPGRKLKAYAEVGPRGFERGLRDGDMDEIQNWIWTNIPSAKRLAFDMWIFKEDKHITMFLMRWS
jgi:predicted chitinase